MIVVEGVGVRLRKFEPKDVPALYAFRNDRVLAAQLGGFSTGYAEADLRNWIDYHNGRADEVIYAIVDQGDEAVGHVGLYQIDHRVRKAEFAILIGRAELHGRGIGKAVTKFMLDFGFLDLNLNKISLTVLANNERAQSLYRSLGFVEEGILRQEQFRNGTYLDVVLMSLLREEWEARSR